MKKKEELMELLKKYSIILSKDAVDYLECLIDLNPSVVKDYISTEERSALNELDIYRKVASYNIYYRALNILKDYRDDLHIISSVNGIEATFNLEPVYLFLYQGHNNITLYKRAIKEDISNSKVKRRVELTNEITNSFMTDYGLKDDDFVMNHGVLTKKIPGITIKQNIK